MINLDQYILEFIRTNFFTLSIVMGILKILAVESKNNVDNKIVSFLSSIIKKNQ